MRAYLSKKDLALCALLSAFCLFLFWDIIIEGHWLSGIDFIAFYLGMKKFLYDEIWIHHSIPFWNPYIFGGMPFWAHFESTIFYPLGFLFWFLSPEKAYGCTMFVHLVLAGIFMYMLSRSFGFDMAGSFVAGAVFMCNGFVMALLCLGQMCPVWSYIWLPLIIYFLNRAITSKTPYFSATIAGVLWGMQTLAGAPQDAFYTFLASALFLACSVKRNLKADGYGVKLLATALLMFVIGCGVAAIQLVPAFELMGKSVRTVLDGYDIVTRGSYPPEGIITTIMPNFFGSYTENTFWVKNVPWSVPYQNLYVGILPVVLLFFISYRRSDNRKLIVFAGCLATVALVLAFGRHTPVYKLAYLFPGFDRFRAPSKIIVLWVFALGLLAGKGMDDLFRHTKTVLWRRAGIFLCVVIFLLVLDGVFHCDRSIALKFFSPFILKDAIPEKMAEAARIISGDFHRLTLLSIFILLSILLWTRGVLKSKLAAASLCAILLIDLGYSNGPAVQHDDKTYRLMQELKYDLDDTIGKDKSTYRVGSYNFRLGPNFEMYLGYQTVGGYTALFLHRFYEYINQQNQYNNGRLQEGWQDFFYRCDENTRLMDLLNVKYEISYASREYALRKNYLPRVFIVPDYKTVKKEEILDYLVRPDFDPTRIVLLEKDPPFPDFSRHSDKRPGTGDLSTICLYRPDSIVISTDSCGPGYLLLSEVFYPGWKAFIDDQPTPIFRGNYLFRVIRLPGGHHVVRFVFDPLSIKIGIGITILTLFLFMAVMVYRFGKRNSLP